MNVQDEEQHKAASAVTVSLRIEPSHGWRDLGLGELWDYRQLLFFIVLRDIKVKYKQTVIGIGWAILQPVFTMGVFTLVFNGLGKIPSEGDVPYPVFSLAGLVPWFFFSSGIAQAAGSLVSGGTLIKRIYFPRLIIPLSAVLSGSVDLVIAFVLLLGMMAYVGIVPTLAVIWVPLFLVLTVATSLGVGLWLCAMNAQFRDIRYAVGFIMQVWLYVTPVIYPTSIVPERWQPVLALNPMVGVVEGFRWALLGTGSGPGPVLIASCITSLLLLVSGAFYFRRIERTFADVI